MVSNTMTTKNITKKGELILQILKETKGIHTAQGIHKKIPLINLTTIYRNLEKLYTLGYIQKILLPHQEYAYEYSKDRHHHALCEKCKKIQHFNLSKETIFLISKLSHLTPSSIEITVKGVCNKKTR